VASRPISDDLLESAETFGRSGLKALAAGDVAVFLLHAGTALEHLSKSFLASLHGSLIARKGDFDSLLHLSGLSRYAGTKASEMRTITLTDALERAGQIVPEVGNLKVSLRPLADARSAVAHAALVDPGAAERTVVPFLRACDLLLAAMERERAAFWGDLLEVVDAREAASAEIATVRALEKLAAARAEFVARHGGLADAGREALVLAIAGSYAPEKYEQTLLACPACSTPALVEGTISVDWEPDWDYADGESYIAGAYPEVTIFPQTLECRACGLHLEGEAELAAAEVPHSWKLEDVDPDDFQIEVEEGWLDV
jgi:hypothetical protein